MRERPQADHQQGRRGPGGREEEAEQEVQVAVATPVHGTVGRPVHPVRLQVEREPETSQAEMEEEQGHAVLAEKRRGARKHRR